MIILTAIWGAVQISFLVLIISNGFNLSKNEEAALKKIDVSHSAAVTLQRTFKFFFKKKQLHRAMHAQDPEHKSKFTDKFVKNS